jgi:MerR family transcriptional regulator, light-induced transcriptional regulator
MPPTRISLREAAELLGVHYMTVYRYVRTGRLPAVRDGVEWRVLTTDVERMRGGEPLAARPRGSRAAARAQLEQRLIEGDEVGAWNAVERALAAGASPAEIHTVLLVPALASIGARWERGELTIADEHRATAVAQRLVGRLGPRFTRRGRKRGTVVLGAVAGETHALPGAILADLLRGDGFDVVDLGPDTPVESFVEAALDASRLVAVLVGAFTPGRKPGIRRTVAALHDRGVTAPVLVGGPGITDEAQARDFGADGWTGHDSDSARVALDAASRAQPTPHA